MCVQGSSRWIPALLGVSSSSLFLSKAGKPRYLLSRSACRVELTIWPQRRPAVDVLGPACEPEIASWADMTSWQGQSTLGSRAPETC